MRHLSLTRRVALVAVGIAVLVGVIFAAALIAMFSLRRADTRESHSKDVTVATLRVQSVSTDLESALRSYALSGTPRFLSLFRSSQARLPREIDRLRPLVRDDPPQGRRVDLAARQLHDYLADYAESVI